MADPTDKQITKNKEQLEQEEAARLRRIAMRRQEQEARQRELRRKRIIRNSYLAILWFGVIGGGFILVAWNWSTVRAFLDT